MNEPTVSEKVQQTISRQQLQPRPRWQFLLRDGVVWTLGGVSVLIGGAAWALIIFMARTHDWDLITQLPEGRAATILASIPYLWLAVVAIFIGVAIYNIRHTNSGYRFRFSFIVALCLMASIVLGLLFHAAGFGRRLERAFESRLPTAYERYLSPRARALTQPEAGLLAGRIIAVASDSLTVTDIYGRSWTVQIGSAELVGETAPAAGRLVGLVGEQTGEAAFSATLVKVRLPAGDLRQAKPRPAERNVPQLRIQ